ncbi:MAG: VWA domain-containing protein, partial [Planctomycetota bacterium]
MSKRHSIATLAVGLTIGFAVWAVSSETARLDRFAHPNGVNCFALSLKPGEGVPPAGPHDVVVVFDTSASQSGKYRVGAMAALKACLGGLDPQDRVRLVAADVNAVALTDSFVGPGSQELAEALQKLEARAPLGATDMAKAMTAAVAQYAQAGANARSVVYIGDGMSPANLLATEAFSQLIDSLADNRVAVSSYPVGPRVDAQLLGALAANTGGQVVSDPDVSAEEIGKGLAAAARGAVLWPEPGSVTWPAEFAEVFPARTPPLRADRDTVVLGTYKGPGPFEIKMTVDTPAGPKPLTWSVVPNPPEDRNNHIGKLVEHARTDGGVSLPLVGSASLQQASLAVSTGVRQASRLAAQALDSGDLASAEKLAQKALEQDPEDNEAQIVLRAVQRRRSGGPDDLSLAGPGAPAGTPGAGTSGATSNLINAVQSEKDLVRQAITAAVKNTMVVARDKMGTEPGSAIQDLKVQVESVRRAPNIAPAARDKLLRQLEGAIREAERRKIELDHRQQEQHEILAAAKERELINEAMLRGEQMMEQLMARFNSLMDEKNYKSAEESTAVQAQELAPGDPVPVLATHTSRMTGYYQDHMALRVKRQKAVVDTLQQVEYSHVPFPDEPPIVYPPAEVWERLSARRIREYSSMTLASQGPAEQLINEELK